jgi:tetratricopeptide (TPR) repeat protein
MNQLSPKLVLALLGAFAFTLATGIELRAGKWRDSARQGGAMAKVLGEGRRLFANQFITMADVYLHSGYYPSIFDQANSKTSKAIVTGDGHEDHEEKGHEGHQHDENGVCDHRDEHEKAMDFMGKPSNWLDAFIRRFRITEHTHLENGREREVLPWLRIAIELDPQKIETYTSTAYWLSQKLGRVKDAEQILREGIRNNPNNPELLFEMGLIQYKNNRDATKARHLWLLALRRWDEQSDEVKKESPGVLDRVAVNLGRLEEDQGNLPEAISYYEIAMKVAPSPEALQKTVNDLKARIRESSLAPLKPAQ